MITREINSQNLRLSSVRGCPDKLSSSPIFSNMEFLYSDPGYWTFLFITWLSSCSYSEFFCNVFSETLEQFVSKDLLLVAYCYSDRNFDEFSFLFFFLMTPGQLIPAYNYHQLIASLESEEAI